MLNTATVLVFLGPSLTGLPCASSHRGAYGVQLQAQLVVSCNVAAVVPVRGRGCSLQVLIYVYTNTPQKKRRPREKGNETEDLRYGTA